MVQPNIFLNQAEIDVIKSKIAANQEPLKSAYNDLIGKANGFLSQGIRTINGDFNTGNSTHYSYAMEACHLVRDCALAYQFSGNTSYADKAVQQINAWCVNSSTRMIPRYQWVSGDNSTINITITIPALLYGASLLTNYSGWNASDKATFMTWCTDFLNNVTAWNFNCCAGCQYETQNYDSWRTMFQVALGAITDNQSNINTVLNTWKTLIVPCQQDTNGSFPRERNRTLNGKDLAIFYSLWNLKAWIQTAEIVRHRGIDLYSFKTSEGKGIELALDFHAKYAISANGWPYSHAGNPCDDASGYMKGGNGDCYELAYSWNHKSAYMNAINACGGRPRYDTRILGPVTLTHAGIDGSDGGGGGGGSGGVSWFDRTTCLTSTKCISNKIIVVGTGFLLLYVILKKK